MGNTKITTLVVGKLCAHVFSSTIPDIGFTGYTGVRLTQIWPPSDFDIDWRTVIRLSDQAVLALSETLSKAIPEAPG